MMGVSHLLISGTATSLFLATADPNIIIVGAIAGILPDVDVSTSLAGRSLPWLSAYLERQLPHRSCTHSVVASTLISFLAYTVAFYFPEFISFAHAIVIGYTSGWVVDIFTRSGVEMFWPYPVRFVCPGNRNLRLITGSRTEYLILVAIVILAFLVFNINKGGGLFTQFDRLTASPDGVERIYNQAGNTHLVIANISGVMASSRAKIKGRFLIIQPHGMGFIVRDLDNSKIYQASEKDEASQIIIEEITADVSSLAVTSIETIFLDDQPVGVALGKFVHNRTLVFITGHLEVTDFEVSSLPHDSEQFPYIQATNNSINLETAPLEVVQSILNDEFATGQLQIRSIHYG